MSNNLLPPAVGALLANFSDLSELNYSIHVSVERRYIYFNNPKAGCTTIKANLNSWEAACLGRELRYRTLAEIHDRRCGALKTPADIGWGRFAEMLADNDVRKIAFVREPVSRVLSAFLSKLTWNSAQNRKLRLLAGRGDNVDKWSLDEFISLLEQPQILVADEHWRPQVRQICRREVSPSFLGRFETLDADLAKLRESLFGAGMNASVIDARKISSENQTTAAKLIDQISSEQRARIEALYAADFAEFYSDSV